MIVRHALTTVAIAIFVMLAVPVAQLRTFVVEKTCCCPDPAKCHCPDHKPDHSKQSSMRACHRTQHEIVSPEAPSFAPPLIAIAEVAPALGTAPAIALAAPHPAPDNARPYGPS